MSTTEIFHNKGYFYLLDRINTKKLNIDRQKILFLVIALELMKNELIYTEIQSEYLILEFEKSTNSELNCHFESIELIQLGKQLRENIDLNPWKIIKPLYNKTKEFNMSDLVTELRFATFSDSQVKTLYLLLDLEGYEGNFIYDDLDLKGNDKKCFYLNFINLFLSKKLEELFKFLYLIHTQKDVRFSINERQGEKSFYIRQNYYELFNFSFNFIKDIFITLLAKQKSFHLVFMKELSIQEKKEIVKLNRKDRNIEFQNYGIQIYSPI